MPVSPRSSTAPSSIKTVSTTMKEEPYLLRPHADGLSRHRGAARHRHLHARRGGQDPSDAVAHVGKGLKASSEAGVPIAFGTDAGVFAHGRNNEEAVMMVERGGMSPRAEAAWKRRRRTPPTSSASASEDGHVGGRQVSRPDRGRRRSAGGCVGAHAYRLRDGARPGASASASSASSRLIKFGNTPHDPFAPRSWPLALFSGCLRRWTGATGGDQSPGLRPPPKPPCRRRRRTRRYGRSLLRSDEELARSATP